MLGKALEGCGQATGHPVKPNSALPGVESDLHPSLMSGLGVSSTVLRSF